MPRGWFHYCMIAIVAAGLSGCVTTSGNQKIDENQVYRVQDRAFRPMGE